MAPVDTTTMAEDHARHYRPRPGHTQHTAGRGSDQPPFENLDETSAPNKALPESLSAALRRARGDGDPGPGDRADPAIAMSSELDGVRIMTTDVQPVAFAGAGDSQRPMIGVWIQLAGVAQLRQGQRLASLGAGHLCLIRGARPFTVELPQAGPVVLVEVPERGITDRFKLWRFALLQAIPGHSGAPAVFCDAIASIQRWSGALQPAMSASLACAVLDLIGAMICFVTPLNPQCAGRVLQQQERIRRAARERLRDPSLTVETIANDVGLSPRQIHRLFAREPLPLMRWVWVQRLEHCYLELRDANGHGRSIAEIAYAWGFNDQAHFSRAFRKHFGTTPRAVRMQPDSAY